MKAALQKNQMVILLILANVVVWAIFIIPNVGVITSSFAPKENEQELLENSHSQYSKNEVIDYSKLRNPFQGPGKWAQDISESHAAIQRQPRTASVASAAPSSYAAAPGGEIKRTFVSRFKLRSIFQTKRKYVASVEDVASSEVEQGVPYSYRFGNQTENTTAKTLTIEEGDVVSGERVVKVTETYVILEKYGLYYKLSFSGGEAVSKP